jgi:HAD superfamily hydrolase (TIGR01509 family)
VTDLDELLRSRTVILLDFDGPVCALFKSAEAVDVAETLHAYARSRGFDFSTPTISNDPLVLLTVIATERPDLALEADTELRRLEQDAVTRAIPTPAAAEFIRSACASGHTVAVASNNSREAIQKYLDAHGLSTFVAAIEGRPHGQPAKMKPEPWILEQALTHTHRHAEQAVMVGDSVGDVRAARALEIPCIGYANKPGKEGRLRNAGTAAVVTSMRDLVAALP